MTTKEMNKKPPIALVMDRLKKWAQKDAALAAALGAGTPDKEQDCWEHIVEQAQKMPHEGVVGCVCVDDETVYRWARDFYVDGKADDAAPKHKGKVYEVEATAEPHPADPTAEEASKADDSQLDLFAEVQA
jgi:hypothetical protein